MPPLAPRLQMIKVDYELCEFDLLAFIDAIQSCVMLNGIGLDSENMLVTKLETVKICALWPHFEPGIQLWLYQLRDMGLEISFQDSNGYDYLRETFFE
jgi:hypothetical protein